VRNVCRVSRGASGGPSGVAGSTVRVSSVPERRSQNVNSVPKLRPVVLEEAQREVEVRVDHDAPRHERGQRDHERRDRHAERD
jgi:hypothetical protein